MRRIAWLIAGAFGSGLPGAFALAAEKGHGEGTGGGMPQLNPESFTSQIFWLVVTFLIFFLIAWRVGLPKIGRVLEDRRERIDRDVSKAVELRNEAETVLAEYEKLSAEGRAEHQIADGDRPHQGHVEEGLQKRRRRQRQGLDQRDLRHATDE